MRQPEDRVAAEIIISHDGRAEGTTIETAWLGSKLLGSAHAEWASASS